MASMQGHKPIEQTNNHVESTVICQKTTPQTYYKANSEHSFTNKVKEMANSALKMFTEHKHQEHHGQNGGHHTPYGHHQGSHLNKHNTAATDKKKKEGHGGNFIANIGEHIKNMKKKKNRKAGKCCNGASSDSSSSSSDDESDNKTSGKKEVCTMYYSQLLILITIYKLLSWPMHVSIYHRRWRYTCFC